VKLFSSLSFVDSRQSMFVIVVGGKSDDFMGGNLMTLRGECFISSGGMDAPA